MKPTPIALPASYAERVSPELAANIVGIGNAALLDEPLLGLIASRECSGQMLVISAFAPSVQRTSRATALERNRLVLALASEVVAPHISANSPLAVLLAERLA